MPGDESDCRARDIKPLGNRADHSQVGGTFCGRGGDPSFQRVTVPAEPRPARPWMGANCQPDHNLPQLTGEPPQPGRGGLSAQGMKAMSGPTGFEPPTPASQPITPAHSCS